MSRHLATCLPQHDPAGGESQQLYHLAVEGYGPFWLHLEVPAKAKFANLDQFLRDIWLECCGHLSAFLLPEHVMKKLGISTEFGFDMEEMPGERVMGHRLAEVLEPGLVFKYEYDFGSTTELRVKVVGERRGKWKGKKVRLLARNAPPEWKCVACDKPAERIDVEDFELLCRNCTQERGEDYLLPVVNSPRMGVCGYTGEPAFAP
jgi:hypothetical protein